MMGPLDRRSNLEHADRPWQQGHQQSLMRVLEHAQTIARDHRDATLSRPEKADRSAAEKEAHPAVLA
jgi:hypothetical protein